jgi:peptide/nickel transport system permease protein
MNRSNDGQKMRRSLTTGLLIVGFLYTIAIFADFLSPYDPKEQTRIEPSAPPSAIRFVRGDGSFSLRPFIYRQRLVDAREMRYEEVPGTEYHLTLLTDGSPHDLFGLFRTNVHLFGLETAGDANAPKIRLLGTDQLGRDRFSRLLYAIRFSLIVSPIGTLLACIIGILFGAVSGYGPKILDSAMMGIADTVIALPTLIVILAARAAFPLELPPLRAATLLIMIFALTGWAEMARLTRGMVVSTKVREYVTAARALGSSESRILMRHILPNIWPALLIQTTLLVPVFFIAEISLSFLGVGLQEPDPSLGNMLSAASDLTKLAASPLLVLSPAVPIFLFVLGIRLIGKSSD